METPGHTPDTGKADHRTSCIGPLTSLFTRLAALQEISGAQKYFVECTVFLFVPKFMDIYWRDRGKADYRTFCWGPLSRILRALSQARPSGAYRAPSSGELFGHCLGRARQAPVYPLRTLIGIATHSFGDWNVAWRSHPTLKSSNVRISVHLRIRFPRRGI